MYTGNKTATLQARQYILQQPERTLHRMNRGELEKLRGFAYAESHRQRRKQHPSAILWLRLAQRINLMIREGKWADGEAAKTNEILDV